MTHHIPANAEQILRQHFEKQPDGSLAWEAYQHALYNWDGKVLDWCLEMAASDDLTDLYGMSFEMSDVFEFLGPPLTHFEELIQVWRENEDREDVPHPDDARIFRKILWFGLKVRACEALELAGVK